ncbi:MAG TPA: DUF6677 family protein [Phycisphaerae bacterium]|nr:DUF6677 family protein [Phycisphaerae bacterium]
MTKTRTPNPLTPFLAGLLGWLIPGAGHVYLGRTLRGVVICICINGLFWTGVAIGGTFTVEPLTQRWWFAAQMCTGASGLAGWFRQERTRTRIAGDLGMDPRDVVDPRAPDRYQPEYAQALLREDLAVSYPADNVARVYSGVAGMLNIMAVFDAVMLAAMGRLGEPPPPQKKPKNGAKAKAGEEPK